jgi:hypothetical protein
MPRGQRPLKDSSRFRKGREQQYTAIRIRVGAVDQLTSGRPTIGSCCRRLTRSYEATSQLLYLLEAIFYVTVGILLSAAALAVLVDAGGILWRGIVPRTLAAYGLQVLDQLGVIDVKKVKAIRKALRELEKSEWFSRKGERR